MYEYIFIVRIHNNKNFGPSLRMYCSPLAAVQNNNNRFVYIYIYVIYTHIKRVCVCESVFRVTTVYVRRFWF